MKGINKLRLNQATMMEILQTWVRTEFKTQALKVTGVAHDSPVDIYTVTVEAPLTGKK
jgi:hypothetical protein